MLLKVRHLTTYIHLANKSFPLVNRIGFDLERGKTLAIVGESGCGKTMTALSLLKLYPSVCTLDPQSKMIFENQNIANLSEKEMRKIRGEKISIIFQDPSSSLHPLYPIEFQLKEAILAHHNKTHGEVYRLIDEILEEVQLPKQTVLKLYPHELSGGMAQRVMIALALINQPQILIADEPTTALDNTIQKQIIDLLKASIEKRKMGVILITHDMHVVAELADEVLVMYASNEVEKAQTVDLFDFPTHPYTQKLFQSRIAKRLSNGPLTTIGGRVPQLTNQPLGCNFHPRCPFAEEICKNKTPPLFSLPRKGHWAKCWMLDPQQEHQFDEETTFTN